MRYDLAAMTKRATNRRRASILLRPIHPTAAQAGDLYRAVYLPVVRGWQQWAVKIAEAYARHTPANDSALVRDAAGDVQDILDQAGQWFDRLVLTLTPALKRWAMRTEEWQRGKFVGSVLTATALQVGTLLSPGDVADTVDAFVARNVALVRSVSDEARGRISDIVLRNYQQRTPTPKVASEMRDAVDLSRARSLRIAADQASKLSNRLDQARQEQAGLDSYVWRHSHKAHPRPEHVVRDGMTFRWASPPEDGPPGTLPFCGCRAQAVIDLT